MRVGVDATSWDNRRGYGRFARNALTRLVELDQDTTYVFFCTDLEPEAEFPVGIEKRLIASTLTAPAKGGSRSLRQLLRLARTVGRCELDAYVFPSLLTWHPTPGVPAVVGVHDTIPHDHPQLVFHGLRERLSWNLKERRAVASAAVLFTVSNSARAALASTLGREPGSIAVVPEAPDPVFGPVGPKISLAGIGDEPYLLCAAGGISPHKNVERLVGAYARLRLMRDGAPRLVIVGSLDDESYVSAADSVRDVVRRCRLGDLVVFPGYVDDGVLASLYRGAEVMVNPSLAEGFGLTAVEAAACGAPLALSDVPAHRENFGAEALFFDPSDEDDIARTLARLLDDSELRRQVGRRCQSAVSSLSWTESGRLLAELVRTAAGSSGKDGN